MRLARYFGANRMNGKPTEKEPANGKVENPIAALCVFGKRESSEGGAKVRTLVYFYP